MTKLAKICGLSTPETVMASIEGEAKFLGFNFFPASPRYVDVNLAEQLAKPARGRSSIVAVTVDPDNDLIDEIVRVLRPDFIQLHGKETAQRANEIRQRSGLGLIKALAVSSPQDVAAASAFDGQVDHLLFDAKPPANSALPGGVGIRFDWDLLSGHRFERPHFLAGGLDPWNLEEAARQSGAPMFDVSSGVERGAGIKDPSLITAFLDAVRRI